MKILSFAFGETYPPTAQWIRIRRMMEGLSSHHEVELVSFTNSPQPEVSANSLIRREPLGAFGFASLCKIQSFIDDYKPDVIFSNTHVPAGFLKLSLSRRTPVVVDMHGLASAEVLLLTRQLGLVGTSSQYLIHRFLEKAAIRAAQRVICVSHHMIHYLCEAYGIGKSKTCYVPNGVDLNLFKPLEAESISRMRRSLGFEDKLVFGYLGNQQAWQGVDELLEAARMTENACFGFLFVGGETKWSTSNIVNLPRVRQTDLPPYYALCDVLVLPRPSTLATMVAAPTKFAEYTAMGKPVLVTNVGDAAIHVKQSGCGIVVNSSSPCDLVQGIAHFQNASDSDLATMGRASRKLAEKEFQWNSIHKRVENALRSVND